MIITLTGTLIGIGLIGIAFSGYFMRSLKNYEQWLIGFGSLFFVAPGINSMIIGFIIVLPVLLFQFKKKN